MNIDSEHYKFKNLFSYRYLIILFTFLFALLLYGGFAGNAALSDEYNTHDVPLFIWIQLIIFLFCSAFFSCSESAIFSLSKVQIIKIETTNKFGRNALISILKDPQKTLNSILLGNLFVNIGASVTGGIITDAYLSYNPLLSFMIGMIGMTFLLLFFTEIFPKTIALEKAELIARYLSPTLKFFFIIIMPITNFISYFIMILLNILKIPPINQENTLTEEELKSLLQLSDVRAVLEEDEKEMIESIIEFRETTAEEIMTPRTDFKAFSIDTPKEEIVSYIKSKGHKRVPIYEGDIDHIIGILHAKDVIVYPEKSIKELVREPIYIPFKKPISQLLNEFRQSSLHMAIVVDEFGGTAGVITLNDILEEIVGEMKDKRDKKIEIDEEIKKLPSSDDYLIQGKIETWAFEEHFRVDLPEDMGRTVGGIIMNTLGRIPEEGDIVSFDFGKFEVKKMDENRIHYLVFHPHKDFFKNKEDKH